MCEENFRRFWGPFLLKEQEVLHLSQAVKNCRQFASGMRVNLSNCSDLHQHNKGFICEESQKHDVGLKFLLFLMISSILPGSYFSCSLKPNPTKILKNTTFGVVYIWNWLSSEGILLTRRFRGFSLRHYFSPNLEVDSWKFLLPFVSEFLSCTS